MNSINGKEKQLIKDIADKIYKKMEDKEEKTSYWIKRQDITKKMDNLIEEYDFDSPIELQEHLRNMWKDFSDEEMQEFILVCSIAAFKNRRQKEMHEISSFVYEF